MKKLIAYILLLAITGQSAFASDCPSSVTLLNRGEPSPCKGYLFSPEKENELYLLSEEHKLLLEQFNIRTKQVELYKSQVLNLEDAITKTQQKSDLWQARAEDSTKKLVDSDNNRGTRDLLFIGMGVVLTVLAGWSIGQAGGQK